MIQPCKSNRPDRYLAISFLSASICDCLSVDYVSPGIDGTVVDSVLRVIVLINIMKTGACISIYAGPRFMMCQSSFIETWTLLSYI